MQVSGKITIAYCKHVNGEETSKEMIIHAVIPIDDPDIYDPQDRWANFMFNLPVPYNTELGDHDELLDKTIKIEIK
jgi:hypothetical protein